MNGLQVQNTHGLKQLSALGIGATLYGLASWAYGVIWGGKSVKTFDQATAGDRLKEAEAVTERIRLEREMYYAQLAYARGPSKPVDITQLTPIQRKFHEAEVRVANEYRILEEMAGDKDTVFVEIDKDTYMTKDFTESYFHTYTGIRADGLSCKLICDTEEGVAYIVLLHDLIPDETKDFFREARGTRFAGYKVYPHVGAYCELPKDVGDYIGVSASDFQRICKAYNQRKPVNFKIPPVLANCEPRKQSSLDPVKIINSPAQ